MGQAAIHVKAMGLTMINNSTNVCHAQAQFAAIALALTTAQNAQFHMGPIIIIFFRECASPAISTTLIVSTAQLTSRIATSIALCVQRPSILITDCAYLVLTTVFRVLIHLIALHASQEVISMEVETVYLVNWLIVEAVRLLISVIVSFV